MIREFQDFLAFLISLPLDFVISGDFNISFGNGSSDSVAMNNILDMFNLKQHVIQNSDSNSVISFYTQYHDTMSTLLDKHAPLKSCKVTSNAIPVNEWIIDEILLSKRKKSSWKEFGEGIEQILIDHDSMHKFTCVTD